MTIFQSVSSVVTCWLYKLRVLTNGGKAEKVFIYCKNVCARYICVKMN